MNPFSPAAVCLLSECRDVSSDILLHEEKQIHRFMSEDQLSLQRCVASTFFCICNPTRAERQTALRTFIDLMVVFYLNIFYSN